MGLRNTEDGNSLGRRSMIPLRRNVHEFSSAQNQQYAGLHSGFVATTGAVADHLAWHSAHVQGPMSTSWSGTGISFGGWRTIWAAREGYSDRPVEVQADDC